MMKALLQKKPIKTAKPPSAIYYTAKHWSKEGWTDIVRCISDNCSEIANELERSNGRQNY